MPSPWDSVTETLSRLNQPVRPWGKGVVSDYVVPPQNRPAPAPPPVNESTMLMVVKAVPLWKTSIIKLGLMATVRV